jgi:hypothetical protein
MQFFDNNVVLCCVGLPFAVFSYALGNYHFIHYLAPNIHATEHSFFLYKTNIALP